MTYINVFIHVSSEKGVPEGAVAQIDISEHKMLCAEIERLRKENQQQREHIMLLNSMIETEHKIIKTKG